MSMALEMSVESSTLHARLTGKFSLQEAKRTFLEMVQEAVQKRASKILVHGQGLKGKPELVERFYYSQYAADKVLNHYADKWRAPSFAYVLKEPTLDPGRFGETVAVNRGMNVRAFANVKEACAWLGIAESDK